MSNLTSAEWAAWVQAIFSIIAIISAAGIAIFQSRAQHKSAMTLYKEEKRYARLEIVKTLSALAKNCAKVVAYSAGKLSDRETIYNIASGNTHFDHGELRRIDDAITGIPFYSLPDTLVTSTMILNSTVRQFREKVEMALRLHREMNAEAFTELFRTFDEMKESIALTCGDIEAEVSRLQGK